MSQLLILRPSRISTVSGFRYASRWRDNRRSLLDFAAKIKVYKCDISSIADIQSVAAQIKKDFGQKAHQGEPTMVLNIAGINNKSLLLDLTPEKVKRMIDINLNSHFWTALTFMPSMVGESHSRSLGERWERNN